MFANILSAKIAALLIAGAVASGGAVAAAVATPNDDHASDTAVETESRGQGAEISELATTLEGGPDKGAQISEAAKGHGQEVSAEVRQNRSGAEKPERP